MTFLFSMLCTLPARANELADFESARALYQDQDYGAAVLAFEALLDQQPARLTRPLLVLESRKYLAASLLFQSRPDEARIQLGRLLRADPGYELDPLEFPRAFLTLFEAISKEYQDVVDSRLGRKEDPTPSGIPTEAQLPPDWQEHLRALRKLAERTEVTKENNRLLSLMPFGLGQFQNGDQLLGTALAVLEGVLLATSVATFLIHQDMRTLDANPGQVQDLEAAERTLRIVNYSSFGAFLATAGGGIAHAQLRYRPRSVHAVPRELPAGLAKWLERAALPSLNVRF